MAGNIVTQISGLNDTMFGKYQAPMKKYINDFYQLAKDNSMVEKIFPIADSSFFAEGYSGETALGGFFPTGEGENPQIDSFQNTYSKTIYNDIEWQLMLSVTRKMIDDANQGSVAGKYQGIARKLIKAYFNTMHEYAGDFLTKAIATTQTFRGKVFDIAGGDGKALFATDHPSITGGADQTNVYNADPLADFDTILNRVNTLASNITDDRGNKIALNFDTIILPSSTTADADLKKIVAYTLNASGDPNSANLRGQYQPGMYNVHTFPYLGSPAGMTASKSWFILMDSEYCKEYMPFVLQRRTPIEVRSWYDPLSQNNNWAGYAREKISPTNKWYGVVAVIPGVGTSLS